MSYNPALPLVSIALSAATKPTGTAVASPLSSMTSKSMRSTTLIRAWQRYLASMWLRYFAWQARRSMRTLLHSLDDRTLRDIGLARGEIETAVSEIQWPRRPRHV